MATPLTRLIFHVDNGASYLLEGTGLAAEYHVFTDKIVWRKLDKTRSNERKSVLEKLNHYFWLMSPILCLPVLVFCGNFSAQVATPIERLGNLGWLLPIIMGFLMFLSFEMLMIIIRETYLLIEAPSISDQIKYFESIFEITIRRNEAWANVKTPYLTTSIVFLFACGFVAPLMFLLYLTPSTIFESLIKLVVLSFILSLIPNMMWNIIFKTLIYRKIMKRLRNE